MQSGISPCCFAGGLSFQEASAAALEAGLEAGHPFTDENGNEYLGKTAIYGDYPEGLATTVMERYLARRYKVLK